MLLNYAGAGAYDQIADMHFMRFMKACESACIVEGSVGAYRERYWNSEQLYQ
jgi:hypothetical protein